MFLTCWLLSGELEGVIGHSAPSSLSIYSNKTLNFCHIPKPRKHPAASLCTREPSVTKQQADKEQNPCFHSDNCQPVVLTQRRGSVKFEPHKQTAPIKPERGDWDRWQKHEGSIKREAGSRDERQRHWHPCSWILAIINTTESKSNSLESRFIWHRQFNLTAMQARAASAFLFA